MFWARVRGETAQLEEEVDEDVEALDCHGHDGQFEGYDGQSEVQKCVGMVAVEEMLNQGYDGQFEVQKYVGKVAVEMMLRQGYDGQFAGYQVGALMGHEGVQYEYTKEQQFNWKEILSSIRLCTEGYPAQFGRSCRADTSRDWLSSSLVARSLHWHCCIGAGALCLFSCLVVLLCLASH